MTTMKRVTTLLALIAGCFCTQLCSRRRRQTQSAPRRLQSTVQRQGPDRLERPGWQPQNTGQDEPEELAEAQKKADDEMKEHWNVVDGVIVFDGKGKSLCTAKDYGDFEMLVDWKIKEKWRQRHLPAWFTTGSDLGSGCESCERRWFRWTVQ